MRRSRLLLVPGMLWLGLFLVLPLLLVAAVSFWDRDVYGQMTMSWHLGNYVRFFDPLYLRIFFDSALMCFLTAAFCLLIGYPVAYYISRAPARARNILLVLVMAPFWINFIIRTYAWVFILRTQGVINTALTGIGWLDQPLALLYQPGTVLLGLVYTLLPFLILPVYVSLEQLDRRTIEAAEDLGANPLRTLIHVVIPQTLPGIAAGCILVFVSAMGMFVIPDILGGAKTVMYSNVIQNQFLSARDWPFGAALSILFIAFSLLLILLYMRAARLERK